MKRKWAEKEGVEVPDFITAELTPFRVTAVNALRLIFGDDAPKSVYTEGDEFCEVTIDLDTLQKNFHPLTVLSLGTCIEVTMSKNPVLRFSKDIRHPVLNGPVSDFLGQNCPKYNPEIADAAGYIICALQDDGYGDPEISYESTGIILSFARVDDGMDKFVLSRFGGRACVDKAKFGFRLDGNLLVFTVRERRVAPSNIN